MGQGGIRKGAGRKPPIHPLKNHSIKFSDLEWDDIVDEAFMRKISASEFIRESMKKLIKKRSV